MRSVVGATATFSASSSKRAEAGSSAIHGKRPVVMSGNGRRARGSKCVLRNKARVENPGCRPHPRRKSLPRSEEHTSELQSRSELVCRLLLEKKKKVSGRHGRK